MKKTGKRWGHSGVPLGGIGAGKIELCPNGRFSNVMTTNNWDTPICDGTPKYDPDRNPVGIPGSFFAAWIKGIGARVLKTHPGNNMPGIKKTEIEYDGFLPKCMMRFNCFKDIELKFRAYGSLRLDNQAHNHYKDSSIPAALFQFELKNAGRTKKEMSLLFSWQGTVGVGGYFRSAINDTRGNFTEFRKGNGVCGVHYFSKRKKIDPRVDGTYSLITPEVEGHKVTFLTGRQPHKFEPYVFEMFKKNGELPGDIEREVDGALAVKFSLKPGEERKVIFVLGWWFPNLIAATNPEKNYGHAYENFFNGSWDAAEYMLANRQAIVDGYHEWHHALMKSKMPDWLRIKLVNDLFPLITNSWYTKDYRFTINEAPTSMGGCAGTIDQRGASHPLYAMCFPELNKAELTLWAEQQITTDHPKRTGKHWNLKTGDFDLMLDRTGSIRHDVGWDDIEGGTIDRTRDWANLHWPDTQTVYVLQCFGHYIWTGDREWFDYIYPKLKGVMEFEERLDQNGDGIADLWGIGSNTYDGEDFPWYGATPFVATLHLAALKASIRMAEWKNDSEFAEKCRLRFVKIQESMEKILWNKKPGYYICWRDESYKNWRKGERPHGKQSLSCMNAQLAGQWFANLYDLGDILPRERIESAMTQMTKRNLACVKYSMANEHYPDGKHTASWPYYSETYYGANAIYENEPDGGFECFEKIYKLHHEYEGSPWDAVLYYRGKDNEVAGWGNFYMTNPASWAILLAIGGFAMNIPDGSLKIAPNVPKKLNSNGNLENFPIFMPQFWAEIDHKQDAKSIKTTFRITKWHGLPALIFKKISSRLPLKFNAEKIRFTVMVNKQMLSSKMIHISEPRQVLRAEVNTTIGKKGDLIELIIEK